ncbi:MAG TPA: HAD-IA family hydrolase [Bacilli bacterium]
MKKKIGIVFDLDGTLLDTLADLHENVNYALSKFNYPLRTREEVRNFVGNGIEKLMRRALPNGVTEEEFLEAFRLFQKQYSENLNKHTKPYPGIIDLLENLKKRGVLFGVVSNKFQLGVGKLVEEYFPGLISVAIGSREGLKNKPAPDAVNLALEELGLKKEEDLLFYVGDSDVDIETARAAKLPVISVAWGFKTKAFLENLKPDYLVDSPEEILAIIEAEERK